MARYSCAVCRLCRREGEKLFLKGERCYTSKCAIERREGGPGQHGKGRKTYSNFKVQLRAKQKAKSTYGVLEKQFRGYFEKASRAKGVTGTELLTLLERRLDNVVYRLGFGSSRPESRQLVGHGHISVNGKRVDIPSFLVKPGDVVSVREGSRQLTVVQGALNSSQSRVIPAWLLFSREEFSGTVQALPQREQLPQNIQEQLIVELYSR